MDKYFMVLHVRKLYFTANGWPVASPQRYAATTQTPVAQNELQGEWQQIVLGYSVVPGYQAEQVSPDFQESTMLYLHPDGTINDDAASRWTYQAPGCSCNGAMESFTN